MGISEHISKRPLTVSQNIFAIVLAIIFSFMVVRGIGLLALLFWPYFAPALIAAFVTSVTYHK
jgi:hypothetical protein